MVRSDRDLRRSTDAGCAGAINLPDGQTLQQLSLAETMILSVNHEMVDMIMWLKMATRSVSFRVRADKMYARISVQTGDFSLDTVINELKQETKAVGGICSFTGCVRDINDGEDVSSLFLEHIQGH